jgi:hypothetical protein
MTCSASEGVVGNTDWKQADMISQLVGVQVASVEGRLACDDTTEAGLTSSDMQAVVNCTGFRVEEVAGTGAVACGNAIEGLLAFCSGKQAVVIGSGCCDVAGAGASGSRCTGFNSRVIGAFGIS